MRRLIFVSLALLAVAFSLNGIGARLHCPPDWISFDRFCYQLIKQRKTWADAERSCAQLQKGSHLISIQSWAESDFVARTLSTYAFLDTVWMGLHEPEKNSSLKWSDGSDFCYTSWQRRELKNVDNQKCVQLSWFSDYLDWNVVNCDSNNIFICKLEPQSVGNTC